MNNQEQEVKPLPCPFCGVNAELHERDKDKDGDAIFQVSCNNDKCSVVPETHWSYFEDKVISNWNRRSETYWQSKVKELEHKLMITEEKMMDEDLFHRKLSMDNLNLCEERKSLQARISTLEEALEIAEDALNNIIRFAIDGREAGQAAENAIERLSSLKNGDKV